MALRVEWEAVKASTGPARRHLVDSELTATGLRLTGDDLPAQGSEVVVRFEAGGRRLILIARVVARSRHRAALLFQRLTESDRLDLEMATS